MQTFIFKIPAYYDNFTNSPERLERIDIIKYSSKWYWSYHGESQVNEVDNSTQSHSFSEVARLVAFNERVELVT